MLKKNNNEIKSTARSKYRRQYHIVSSVVLLDTCPRMVDKVLMSIPFATDVVAKLWRRSWNLTFLHSALSNIIFLLLA